MSDIVSILESHTVLRRGELAFYNPMLSTDFLALPTSLDEKPKFYNHFTRYGISLRPNRTIDLLSIL